MKVLLAIFPFVTGFASMAAEGAVPPAADVSFHELAPHSLSLSPDGRWLAFGRSSRSVSGDLTMDFLVHDVTRGKTLRISTYNYGSLNFGPRPVWSPDSRLLAYYAVVDEALQMKVWDRQSARELPQAVTVDKAGHAELQRPQWTPDSRFVICLSSADPQKRLFEEQEGDNYTARLRAELVGQRPAPSGVTLLATPAISPLLQAQYGNDGSSGSAGLPRTVARQIVALDINTGETQVLAHGAQFVQLQVADTGAAAVAGAMDAHGDFLVYELPLPDAVRRRPDEQSASIPDSAETALGVDGAPLRMLFKSAADQPFQNFNLSPSGRFATYLIEDSGDIVIIDLVSGDQRNLTAAVPKLIPEGSDAELQKIAGRFDLPLYQGKFGTGRGDAPVWTADESALLMRRVLAQKSVTLPHRAELWRISRTDGSARRLVQDTGVSIVNWANCPDRSRVNCVAGAEGSVLALVRTVQVTDSDGVIAYARIDPESGAVQILRTASMAGGNELLVARETGDIIALEEAAERPPELWHVPVLHLGKARSLEVLNPEPLPAIGEVQRLQWISSTGETLFAALRMPSDMRDGERAALIVDVYPGRRGLASSRRFDPGRLNPLRVHGHFALLTPDLPVKFGSGTVCSDIARYAVEALDAAIATGRVDGARGGVMGISYGGYSVNCIITHTDRFRAAVSEAGPSNMASTHALGGRGEWNVTKSWQWETPKRMIAESPVYHLDKVTTPTLFVAGKTDMNNALQEYEMYFGLLALNRPAALASYDNAGHGDYDRFPHFWPRILAWFNTYLAHDPLAGGSH